MSISPQKPSLKRKAGKADPNDGTVLIFLAHSMIRLEQLAKGVGLGVWSAITQFQALGSDARRSCRSGV